MVERRKRNIFMGRRKRGKNRISNKMIEMDEKAEWDKLKNKGEIKGRFSFATSKNIAKSTMFQHKVNHKYTWTSLDGTVLENKFGPTVGTRFRALYTR